MKRPPPVSDRPVIRVIHPSGHMTPHLTALEAGLAELESHGCRVRWDATRGLDSSRGYLAGDDASRAKALCAALDEPEVEIIWAARGGSGLNRILREVVQHAKGHQPRCVVGFSDVTSLLNAFALHLGWITYHGPVITTLGREEPHTCLDTTLAALQGQVSEVVFPRTDGPDLSGQLLGGNLTVLASMVGDHLCGPPLQETIWLLEDIGEAPYRLDRCFTQLRQSGALATAQGLWFGDLDLEPSLEHETIAHLASDAGLPALRNAPAGHRGPLALLPIGAQVTVSPRTGCLATTMPWVDTDDC